MEVVGLCVRPGCCEPTFGHYLRTDARRGARGVCWVRRSIARRLVFLNDYVHLMAPASWRRGWLVFCMLLFVVRIPCLSKSPRLPCIVGL